MSRQQSPNRKKAFKMWCESGRTRQLASIARELGVNPNLIRKWKHIDDWENTPDPLPRGRGAPKGNKNAIGNKGGAPKRNANALVHGEFATIWMDALEVDEKMLLFEVETDKIAQIENEIRLLELRERRMLQLRAKVMDGWDNQAISSKSELFDVIVEGMGDIPTFNEDGTLKNQRRKETVLKETERVTKTPPKLERILSIEDALTRVQEKKGKFIELLNKIELRELSDEEQKLRIDKLQAEVKAMNEKAW